MKKFLLFFLFSLNSFLLFADDAVNLFNSGNEYYKKSEYDSALIFYQRVVDLGKVSPELYYNIGNTYYKKGMLGEAILYYEKAILLAPYDEDLKQNLEIARARTIDKIDPLPQIFYKRWIIDLKNIFAPNTWAVTTVILIWLFFIGITAYLLSRTPSIRKIFFASAIIISVLFITSAVIAYDRYNQFVSNNSAIVFESSVYVKSSPEERSTNLFMLHEGTKVQVLEELSNWRKIRIANGNIGWIKEDAIKTI